MLSNDRLRIDEAGLYKAEDTLLKASALDAYKDADEISKYAVEAMECKRSI